MQSRLHNEYGNIHNLFVKFDMRNYLEMIRIIFRTNRLFI